MKIFVDTANLQEIEAALKTGWVDGVTTNPSLLAKEPKSKFEEHVEKILDLIRKYTPGVPLSVEVFSKNPEEMLRQAENFKELFDKKGQLPSLAVKIQIGWEELDVIRKLAAQRPPVPVNCTACMTVSQAAWAAKAGARYASLFWGRIRDASPAAILQKLHRLNEKEPEYEKLLKHHGEAESLLSGGACTEDDFNPASVVRRTREIFDREKFNCEIIAGSIRTIWDIRDALLAGAHIVTVPPKFFPEFPKMAQHFKTDEVVQQFLADFEKWLS